MLPYNNIQIFLREIVSTCWKTNVGKQNECVKILFYELIYHIQVSIYVLSVIRIGLINYFNAFKVEAINILKVFT